MKMQASSLQQTNKSATHYLHFRHHYMPYECSLQPLIYINKRAVTQTGNTLTSFCITIVHLIN
jgi:hypothetical protein